MTNIPPAACKFEDHILLEKRQDSNNLFATARRVSCGPFCVDGQGRARDRVEGISQWECMCKTPILTKVAKDGEYL